jgi:hypothetical protein
MRRHPEREKRQLCCKNNINGQEDNGDRRTTVMMMKHLSAYFIKVYKRDFPRIHAICKKKINIKRKELKWIKVKDANKLHRRACTCYISALHDIDIFAFLLLRKVHGITLLILCMSISHRIWAVNGKERESIDASDEDRTKNKARRT